VKQTTENAGDEKSLPEQGQTVLAVVQNNIV